MDTLMTRSRPINQEKSLFLKRSNYREWTPFTFEFINTSSLIIAQIGAC